MTQFDMWLWQDKAVIALAAQQERYELSLCEQASIRMRINAAFPSAGKQFFVETPRGER